jgi:cytochrome c-type biogenesis protein
VHAVLFSTTLLASFLGGIVALLAPCCVSVMLPAFFASGLRHRTGLAGVGLVFGAGVATVILPIAIGASALSATLAGHHLLVFSAGGAAMTVGGLAMLFGWKPRLPMIGMRPRTGNGLGSTYALGVFSGAASACCAPVLAGVAVLSGAASSFAAALSIGAAYVLGMVAPLCAVALVWDRRDWGRSRLFADRKFRLPLPGRRETTIATLAAAILLVAMGVLAIVVAFTGPSMPTSGWRVTLSARLQHYASVVTRSLSWLPGWAVAVLLLAGVVGVLAAARRRGSAPPWEGAARPPDRAASASVVDEPIHDREGTLA